MTLPTPIRQITINDAKVIVSIHLNSFQGFFLTFLGPNFLRVLYQSISEDPSGIGFIAEDPGGTGAFVMGTTQPSGLYERLLRKHWWQFGWAALPALVKKPGILPRLLRAFAMPGQELPTPKCGNLMSIAVDPSFQGRGLGKQLVIAFLTEAARRGCTHVNLTTDALGNEPTNAFYQKMGFELYRTYTTPEGRRMNDYLIALSPLFSS
jgi:GNAT superfamily N-acetyltransferase